MEVKKYADIVMDDGGVIRLELYPEHAPITVENFLKLASEKFYDGLIFHRVVPDFVIQGGDPTGTGTGSSAPIKGEFQHNGVDNPIRHARGVISMARRGDSYDSGSCQFFIVLKDAFFLDGDYAAFGAVRDGLDEVDKIAKDYAEQRIIHKMKTVKVVEE